MSDPQTTATTGPIPRRALGKTGREVTLFGLGGEGILRTFGKTSEAVKVIHRALDQGVNYCDTAPAYDGSMDYYGAALGERRRDIFLASKTADRSRDGSLRILDDSLKRLRTDRLDLWQLHDLRTLSELDRIFAKGGAIEAMVKAREEGRVSHLGITGHHDPEVLLEAMRRFDFDTVLVALNCGDVHRMPFINTVLPEAARRGMGVIGMKVSAQGALIQAGVKMEDCMGYVLSLPGVSNVIVGCNTVGHVDENAAIARAFAPFDVDRMQALETRTQKAAERFIYYKKPAA